ncbi:MAG: metalloendopeptidase-like rane protein [Planctomycetaceae bacterium]|nr:metalloendopeptidase-like rane protein [Planctomycetaceae bacterium]
MSRDVTRHILTFLLLSLGLSFGNLPLSAADDLTVFAKSAENPHGGRLYQWLRGQAQVQFDKRRLAIAALKTPEDVLQRQRMLKEKFIAALGGFPERTPLNPQVTGRIERNDFSVEKVLYESRPQHHVTACLYLPKGKGPFPGVLVPCGHSANGKAIEAYQRACILLVKNGMAVLCYDPIGQGERIQLLNEQGKPAIPGSTSEHTMIGVGALLVGSNCATYRIWDGIRSLDYLASRPEVDPQRLGCTGNSGGGTLTSYLMALDDRIQAAAPSCYITSLERLFATIGPQDAEQNITGQVEFGLEHADYLTLRAPKPTLVCVGTKDFFDIDGAWTSYREAKAIYGLLGYGERVEMFEFNDPHGFSIPRRQAAMRWMRRWLLKQDDSPVESDFPIFTDQELQVTRTGQVLDDLKGVSAFDLTRMQAEAFQRQREKGALPDADLRTAIRELIHLPTVISAAKLKSSEPSTEKVVARDGYVIRKLVYETESGIELPALLWELKEEKLQATGKLTLYLHGLGKETDAAVGGEIERLLKSSGSPVLAVDVRGLGELSSGVTKNFSEAFGADAREAILSLHLNRPLLGQRVLDVLSIVDNITTGTPKKVVEIIAVGTCGPIAQHAAIFDSRISKVSVRDSVASWTSVATTPISKNQLSNVVPGALKTYDLPDLERLCLTQGKRLGPTIE